MTHDVAPIDVVVRDGSTVCLRRAVDRDIPALLAFLASLSPHSLYQRFMGLPVLTPDRVRLLTPSSERRGAALIAECHDAIVAFAGFYPLSAEGTNAEVAFAVADAMQGHGIGTKLLEQLAAVARAQGIFTFEADVLGDNQRMLDVFRESGYGVTSAIQGGVWRVTLSLSLTEAYADRAATRSRIAASASMRAFFEPTSVAVIGANRERGKIGAEILHNLVVSGFTGQLAAVHPTATAIDGVRAYPRIADVPAPVDLAVIVVPARHVLDAVDECIAVGVPALCVISAGFGESDAEGRAREAALVERVRRAGCRLVGPNCMGLLNTDPAVRLNATFSPVNPPAGTVAMSTQSGALGLAILDYATRLNIGISSFVSVGNKPDVSGNDLIQYWAEDPRTSVILLYLESFGNPRKFSEIARRVGRTKPIVAVKAGRSAAGSRAASSHTGALASSDTVVDALFRQSGVIRTERLEELTDAPCAELRSFLPQAASVGNPVDMLASAPPDHYRRALSAILQDDQIDSVITIFIPPLVTDPADVATAIREASRTAGGKPILGVFMRAEGAPSTLAPIPCYAFPESAALALARVSAYGQWRGRPIERVPALDGIDRRHVRDIVESALVGGGGWMTADQSTALLTSVGIHSATAGTASTLATALETAARIGYPVALKAIGPTLLHKTERRAVALDLATPDALREAYRDLEDRLGADMTSVLVQQMVPKGVEMIVGAVHDPSFGPLVACGTGGVLVDVLADASFRLHPLTASDAGEMIDELRGARLLRGYRGAPPADEAALRDVLLRISSLIELAPEIQELDLNPVIVKASGAVVADARIRLDGHQPPRRGRRVEY
jgi:acyl-CoA synthetase (NDP forming)/GNAT superfamily N-acetyltransferase